MTGTLEFLEKPHFHLELPVHSNDSLRHLEGRGISNCGLLLETLVSSGLHPRLWAVLHELSCFSFLANEKFDQESALFDPETFVYRLYSIHCDLLSFSPDTGRSSDLHLNEAIRMGALLYIKDILQNFLFSPMQCRILVQNLKDGLSEIPCTKKLAPVFLWLCLVGANASNTGTARTWFTAHLVRVAASLNIRLWEDVKAILNQLVWIEKLQEVSYRQLWEEVSITLGVLQSAITE
jgi:hypothetical protein